MRDDVTKALETIRVALAAPSPYWTIALQAEREKNKTLSEQRDATLALLNRTEADRDAARRDLEEERSINDFMARQLEQIARLCGDARRIPGTNRDGILSAAAAVRELVDQTLCAAENAVLAARERLTIKVQSVGESDSTVPAEQPAPLRSAAPAGPMESEGRAAWTLAWAVLPGPGEQRRPWVTDVRRDAHLLASRYPGRRVVPLGDFEAAFAVGRWTALQELERWLEAMPANLNPAIRKAIEEVAAHVREKHRAIHVEPAAGVAP